MTTVREVDIAGSDDPRLMKVAASFRDEGRTPIALHRVIANSPGVLLGFHAFSDALRYATELPSAIRELAILRTAQLTNSSYEWVHHVVLAERFGVSQADIDGLASWGDAGFDEATKAALRVTDELASSGVTAEAMADLATHFDPPQVVDLVVCISHYHAVARITQALEIDVELEYRDAYAALGRREPDRVTGAESRADEKAIGGTDL